MNLRPTPIAPSQAARAKVLFEEQLALTRARHDYLFTWIMAAQWLAAIAISVVWSPLAWVGHAHSPHIHVYFAFFVGAAISVPIMVLTRRRPGRRSTRYAVAVGQMLWSAVLIHLTGGRIETHFHIFGSLAFLAFYREHGLIVAATVVVAADHLVRGVFLPESVYGIGQAEWWRFLEHAGWVVFEDVVLVMGIHETVRVVREYARQRAELEALQVGLEEKIVERTADLHASREQFRAVLEATRTLPWQCEPGETRLAYIGSRASELFGGSAADWVTSEFWSARMSPENVECWRAAIRAASAGEERDFELRFQRDDGRELCVRAVAAGTEIGGRRTACGFMVDVTEQRKLEVELRQAQKLESVGRLASGVAHEINTPIQFVSDSVHFVKDSMGDVVSLLREYQALQVEVSEGRDARGAAESVRARADDVDIEYVVDNAPKALDRALEGLGRVAGIVRSMKTFAHADCDEMRAVDLNEAVRATLTIARNEYKYVADAETVLGELPLVVCHGGEINQALLNLVVNASHAIEEVVRGTEGRGRITVTTRVEGSDVVVAVEDTGGGIPVAVRERIFDPFFTTKGVGRGTGQGLTISRVSVVERHRGELTFETELGRGTTFFLKLPIAGAVAGLEAA